MPLPISEQ